MKTKNHNILPEDDELAPELEWLLQSHQFSAAELVKGLVQACYPQLIQWLALNLGDSQGAELAARNTILRAANNAYSYPGEPSALIWVFRQGVGELRRAWRKQLWIRLRKKLRFVSPSASDHQNTRKSQPETNLDAALWQEIDKLPAESRLAFNLAYGLGMRAGSIAQVLEMSPEKADRLLKSAYQELLGSVQTFVAEAVQATSEGPDQLLTASLARRHSQLIDENLDLAELAVQAVDELDHQAQRQTRSLRWKETLWMAGTAGIITAVLWALNIWLAEPGLDDPASGMPQPAAQATSDDLLARGIVRMNYFPKPGETVDEVGVLLKLPPGEIDRLRDIYSSGELDIARPVVIELSPPKNPTMPTPVAPAARRVAPLTVNSSPAEIRNLMNKSHSMWQSLWLDAVYFNYGLPGFTGLPQTIRVQAWLSQPDTSLAVIWNSSEDSTLTMLKKDEMVYFVSPAGIFQARRADTPGLYSSPLAMEMVDPGHSEIFNQPGQMQVLGEEEIAGRQTVVVDWRTDKRGVWPDQYKIWIDAQLGIVLRYQFFAKPISDAVLGDVIFASLAQDVTFPQPDLFSPYRLPERVFVSDFRGEQVDPSVLPLFTQSPVRRVRLPLETPSPGFDPAKVKLTLQFPGNLDPHKQLVMADVFAGSAYLGQIVLSNPVNTICVRSQDDQMLAYTYDPFGNPDIMGIGWFKLEYPIHLKRVEIPLIPNSLAFSPDGRYLAYFASPLYASPGSLAVIDTQTGRHHQLAQLIYATSLVWGPDSKLLAMLVANPEPDKREVRILDVASKTFIFRQKISVDSVFDPDQRRSDWPAPDWPARDWGVTFPVPEQHVLECLNPGS